MQRRCETGRTDVRAITPIRAVILAKSCLAADAGRPWMGDDGLAATKPAVLRDTRLHAITKRAAAVSRPHPVAVGGLRLSSAGNAIYHAQSSLSLHTPSSRLHRH